MAISSKTRKLLWGRAHNACAMCQKSLTGNADSSARHGLVFGEEAHIVARREDGPRGRDGDRSDIDGYGNLILLCAEDHKSADEQPEVFTVSDLLRRKAAHEKWADDKFIVDDQVRLFKAPGEDEIKMELILSGEAVWNLVDGTGLYNMRSVVGDDDPEATDAADNFLNVARDWGNISQAVSDKGFGAIRDAQRSLDNMLLGLTSRGLYVYGRRVNRTMRGGATNTTVLVPTTHLVVLTLDELRERGGIADPPTD